MFVLRFFNIQILTNVKMVLIHVRTEVYAITPMGLLRVRVQMDGQGHFVLKVKIFLIPFFSLIGSSLALFIILF